MTKPTEAEMLSAFFNRKPSKKEVIDHLGLYSNKPFQQAADMLESQQWISVEDRLPELGEYVLVINDGRVTIGFLYWAFDDFLQWEVVIDNRTRWSGEAWELSTNVTRWTPLPEPPETE